MKLWLAIFFLCLMLAPSTHAQTLDQLIAGAKNEGKLVIYASAAAQQLQMYMAAFNKRYPFIKTEYFRTDKQKLVTRVLLEEQAKQRLADVVHTSVIETHILKKRGALSRYVPMESASYPTQYKDPEGYWTSVYASGTLMGFNTRQVKKAEAPKTYDDLLNPRWKNMIAVDNTKIEWFSMLLKLKGRAFMEKLAAQNGPVMAGNTNLLNLLAAGEFAIMAGVYEYSVDSSENQRRAGGLDRARTGDHLHRRGLLAVAAGPSLRRQAVHRVAAHQGRPRSYQSIRPRADPRRHRFEIRQAIEATQIARDRRRPEPTRSRSE